MIRTFLSATVLSTAVLADGSCSAAESELWIGSDAFTSALQKCAIANLGDGGMTSSCLVEKYSTLSSECAACFGATVQCGRKQCMSACAADSGSAGCLECVESKGCNSALAVCTGIAQGPPNPVPKSEAISTTSTTKSSVITAGAYSILMMLVVLVC